jgi:hypothetical protein
MLASLPMTFSFLCQSPLLAGVAGMSAKIDLGVLGAEIPADRGVCIIFPPVVAGLGVRGGRGVTGVDAILSISAAQQMSWPQNWILRCSPPTTAHRAIENTTVDLQSEPLC